MTVREMISELDHEVLVADGFDDALIGLAERAGAPDVAAYDASKCLDILVAQGMSESEAAEHLDFNVFGSWVGERTPVFIHRLAEPVSGRDLLIQHAGESFVEVLEPVDQVQLDDPDQMGEVRASLAVKIGQAILQMMEEQSGNLAGLAEVDPDGMPQLRLRFMVMSMDQAEQLAERCHGGGSNV